MITQKELKKLLHYDPDTGIFLWRKPSKRIRDNLVAGTTHKTGYIEIRVKGKKYKAHRLAWLYTHGEWPKCNIDHINQNRSDNRIKNLREANHKENSKNAGMYKNNTSGVMGVRLTKGKIKRKWRAVICVNRRSIHVGYFEDKFEAICARKSAENKYGFHVNHGKNTEK
jgi:hypothetical protein